MTELTTPGPGIFPDVPMEEYLAWECYSRSWIADLEAGDSPRVVQYRRTQPKVDTAATAMGTALHLAVLEPTAALDKIAVAPEINRRTNAGKAEWIAYQEANRDRTILKADEWALVEAMADSIARDPVCSEFVTGLDDREVSVVWDEPVYLGDVGPSDTERMIHPAPDPDPRTIIGALPFKCRVDAVCTDRGFLVDLKTTRAEIRPYRLAREVEAYGYAFQSILYPRGWASACETPGLTLVSLWVSKEPPHDCLPTELSVEAGGAAARATDKALRDLLYLHDTYGAGWDVGAFWPGAGAERDEVTTLSLPGLERRYRVEETWPTD